MGSGIRMGMAGLVMVLLTHVVVAAQDQSDRAPVPEAGAGARPAQFSGAWAYNSQDSVNLATGRPERGPRGGAPPRPLMARPAPTGRGASDEGGEGNSQFSPSTYMLRENRDLTRDLLEIAETLTFAVAEDSVTVTDDLKRERTFPTDNERQRYRLGASEFFARVRWEDGRLHRDIEGTFGAFKMSETYFLSPDANRLFLIIRVGDVARGRVQAAVDRVYDRVNTEDQ
jgi:hypothetical protein